MTVENMVVAICFNDENKSQKLASDLFSAGLKAKFIMNPSFEQFLNEFMSAPIIDCFIIEENFSACSTGEFVQKLKHSQKYKKMVTAITVDDMVSNNSDLQRLNVDLIFDISKNIAKAVGDLKKLVSEKCRPTIPENFNVLVLDDNEAILELVSRHLMKLKHQNFDLCRNVASAKEMLAEKHYDLLILDWNLTDGSCLDVLEFIKADNQAKKLKNNSAHTIVVTGRDDVDDIMTLLRYGVKDHIIKPFDFDEFEDKVSYAIEKHQTIKVA